jgi:hypothetical protein
VHLCVYVYVYLLVVPSDITFPGVPVFPVRVDVLSGQSKRSTCCIGYSPLHLS